MEVSISVLMNNNPEEVGTLGHLLVTVQRSYVTSHGHGWMNHES